MSISLYLRNALTRQRNRNDFAVRVAFLSSQSLDRLSQLAATLERYTDQEKGLGSKLESPKALRDEVELRFEALCNKLGELQTIAAQQARR